MIHVERIKLQYYYYETINCTSASTKQTENVGKKVAFKNCAPFTECISKINNTQIDNDKYIDVIRPMYNLIEYNDNVSKT